MAPLAILHMAPSPRHHVMSDPPLPTPPGFRAADEGFQSSARTLLEVPTRRLLLVLWVWAAASGLAGAVADRVPTVVGPPLSWTVFWVLFQLEEPPAALATLGIL